MGWVPLLSGDLHGPGSLAGNTRQIINPYDAEERPCAANEPAHWLRYSSLSLWSVSTCSEKKENKPRAAERAVKCVASFESSVIGFSFFFSC